MFLLSVVSIEAMSLFQFVGASRLFLEKLVFPIFPYYTEKKSFKWMRGIVSARKKWKKKWIDKSEHLKVHCYLLWGFLIISTFFFFLSKPWRRNGWSSDLCSYRNNACFMVNVISGSETTLTFHSFSTSVSNLF